MSKKDLEQSIDTLEKRFDNFKWAVAAFMKSVNHKLNLTGTAGECTCTHRTLPDPDCPVDGLPRVIPDIPLHARVAKDLRKIADALEKGEANEEN